MSHSSHIPFAALAGIAVVGGSLLLGSRRAGVEQEVATFAGGCFWSMQKAFDGEPGVVSVTAGYAGGKTAAESVELVYDRRATSYERLLDIYWRHIDPLVPNRSFCDRGPQYRSIIFYHDDAQRRAAEASKRALDQSHRFRTPIVTAIEPATAFYPAEEYHQYFYRKHPARYEAYRIGCGRDKRLREVWGELALSEEVGQGR